MYRLKINQIMRILNIVSDLQKASGVTTFVEHLVAELRDRGHEVNVLTRKMPDEGSACLVAAYDLVHIHGLWDPWLHRWAKAACKAGVKVVWSPHGMLTPWALRNKWWKKLPAFALYQWRDLHRAVMLHVTASSEVADVRRLCLKNPIVVAPLGVDRIGRSEVESMKEFPGMGRGTRTLLFVSRVQRKKGLPNLLLAWSCLPDGLRKGWRIRIVGPDEDNHTAELKKQAKALGIAETVDFVGPRYGAELGSEYQSANLFVLPTHSENFGSVVIEALSHGLPVICTKGAPWAELVTYRCGWWIEDSVESLTDALKVSVSLPITDLYEMGARGRKLVEEKYTWKAVCDAMVDGYRRIVFNNRF